MNIFANGTLLDAIHTIGRNGPALREWWVQSIRLVPDEKRGTYRKAWMKRCAKLGIDPVRATTGVIVYRSDCAPEPSAAYMDEGGVPAASSVDPREEALCVIAARLEAKAEALASAEAADRYEADDWLRWHPGRLGSPAWCAHVIGCTSADVTRIVRKRAAEIQAGKRDHREDCLQRHEDHKRQIEMFQVRS